MNVWKKKKKKKKPWDAHPQHSNYTCHKLDRLRFNEIAKTHTDIDFYEDKDNILKADFCERWKGTFVKLKNSSTDSYFKIWMFICSYKPKQFLHPV